MQVLYALDLTNLRGAGDFCREGHLSPPHKLASRPELPPDGFPSLLGFWFATAESWGSIVTPLRVEIFDPGEKANSNDVGVAPYEQYAIRSYTRRARLRLKARLASNTGSATQLFIQIDPATATIGIEPQSWSKVSDTVLLVVAQFWRFFAIDQSLDELTSWVRADLATGGLVNRFRPSRSRALRSRQHKFQRLLLDLPDVEGYLTNPRSGLSSSHSVQLYRALARQLGLNRQRRALDERVEVVEAVLNSLIDAQNHIQALAFQVVLELAIVTLLLLDLGLHLWDWLAQ